jgi:hypothetical protein
MDKDSLFLQISYYGHDRIFLAVARSAGGGRMTREEAVWVLTEKAETWAGVLKHMTSAGDFSELKSIEQYETALRMGAAALRGWVKTADKLPERMELLPCSVRVLINSFTGVVTAQYDFEDGIWIDFFIHKHSPFNCPNNYGETMEVTHWMPLPPFPEVEG